MELKVLENPDLEVVASALKKAIMSKQLIVVLGECRVDYEGRAASRLEPGERLVIIKQDGAILVHRPTGYSPVNWQPPSPTIEVVYKPGIGLILHTLRDRPREYLTVVFTKILLLVVSRLRDVGEFTMYIDEKEMRDVLAKNPSLIEEGLRVLAVEKMVGGGYVDIYAVDGVGRHVLIELKRVTATREAVLQLYKYVESYRIEYGVVPRGILMAPAFSPTALETALKLGLECKHVDPKKLWELLKKGQRRKAALTDFQGRPPSNGSHQAGNI
ncbi:MAG: endonuclease NucS [Desulfurococcaceae archaeon]